MTLRNYASRLAETGQLAQALDYAKRALDIYERLASNRPKRFEPEWAMSLNSYASRLADIGKLQGALACTRKALTIFEQLAQDRGLKFQSDVQVVQLQVALWEWLCGIPTQLPITVNNVDSVDASYAMRPAYFFRQVLVALKIEKRSEKAAIFDGVWKYWSEMSKAQQTEWEYTFFLICAYAEANTCLPDHLGGWRYEMSALNTRLNRNLPRWMTLVAERKGFSLGV